MNSVAYHQNSDNVVNPAVNLPFREDFTAIHSDMQDGLFFGVFSIGFTTLTYYPLVN